ncbi:MAG: glycosyl transferase family 1 [Verrucomicrobiae bacterium]|nr:glycosyl transferase family 1 [Verrucomicrobiae bacterium]
MCSIGQELTRMGHRVTVVARGKAEAIAGRFGLGFCELGSADLSGYRPPWRIDAMMLGVVGLSFASRLRARWKHMARLVLDFGPPELIRLGVDGLLVDQDLVAGGTVAERLGLPFVSVSNALHWNEEAAVPPHYTGWSYSETLWAMARNRLGHAAWHGFMRPVLAIVNRQRDAWGLARLRGPADTYSPLAQIGQGCRGLDFPRRELPSTFHYVGALGAERSAQDDDFPWDRLDGRPLIYASMGTVPHRANALVLQKVAVACAGTDAQLVIGLGRWKGEKDGAEACLRDLPGDPLVVDFVPQLRLLDRAALLVTHAGMNTVGEALSRAVCMLALPRNADQFAVAARLVHAGVGLRASFRRSTPGELRGLIGRLLAEPEFRARAERMRREIVDAGGARRAAAIAERALVGRRPVARDAPL